jgi:hypothetical protein
MVMALLFDYVDGEEQVAGDPSVCGVLAKKKGHHYRHENQGHTNHWFISSLASRVASPRRLGFGGPRCCSQATLEVRGGAGSMVCPLVLLATFLWSLFL